MDENNLLDDANISQDRLILDLIQWWEKRRVLYNIIVGLTGLLALLKITGGGADAHFYDILLFVALPYGLFANIAYLTGWVMDLLLRYYFKITITLSVRRILFWSGTALSVAPSIFMTIFLYFVK
ncbi:MAG: Unknown protein [uncultured Aureispira sp.]|uniref:Uncharacterized protein n=1 Tax=uncultured Aureispira sp. TaxID=1331704 RepID=A0A6S6S7J8_9BACT|nr:MAG: Unknown protein [uncultured Aureispira sp.]